MQIGAQQSINPRLAVPHQRIEIVAHRVERVAARRGLHCPADIALIGGNVLVLKPDADERFVMIRPRCIRQFVAPIRALADDDARVEFVEGEHALPRPVLAQKQDKIGEDRADAALGVKLEVIDPVKR